MKLIKHVLIRILVVVIPLTALYLFSIWAFEENRHKEHPTDVGLEIAVLLASILFFLFIIFLIDFIIRLVRKEYKIAVTDIPFLLLFLIPCLYISCLFSGEGFYCDFLTHLF
nr:hypothetical protein [uncultured Chryseobacterium sp.]